MHISGNVYISMILFKKVNANLLQIYFNLMSCQNCLVSFFILEIRFWNWWFANCIGRDNESNKNNPTLYTTRSVINHIFHILPCLTRHWKWKKIYLDKSRNYILEFSNTIYKQELTLNVGVNRQECTVLETLLKSTILSIN